MRGGDEPLVAGISSTIRKPSEAGCDIEEELGLIR